MKRVAVLCLVVLVLLPVVLAGCKSGTEETSLEDVPQDQKALGANLMKELPAQPGSGGEEAPTPPSAPKADEGSE